MRPAMFTRLAALLLVALVSVPVVQAADRDKLLKDNNRGALEFVEDIYPMEWRKAIRSVIIPLFKAGVIRLSYHPRVSGVVTAAAEPGPWVSIACCNSEKVTNRHARPEPTLSGSHSSIGTQSGGS